MFRIVKKYSAYRSDCSQTRPNWQSCLFRARSVRSHCHWCQACAAVLACRILWAARAADWSRARALRVFGSSGLYRLEMKSNFGASCLWPQRVCCISRMVCIWTFFYFFFFGFVSLFSLFLYFFLFCMCAFYCFNSFDMA